MSNSPSPKLLLTLAIVGGILSGVTDAGKCMISILLNNTRRNSIKKCLANFVRENSVHLKSLPILKTVIKNPNFVSIANLKSHLGNSARI